jgi:Type II secretion system (T2SS), protein E, N-terminal domain
METAAMTMFDTSQAAPAAPAVPPYSSAEMRSYPLGTLVYRAGLMPLETVNRALAEAADSGRRLGEVLVEYGLPERELTRLLAAQHGQEFVDLVEYPIDTEIAHLLPRTVAEMYCAIPLRREGDCTIVAVPDADNSSHLTRLREALHGPIRLVTAARADIKDAIERIHEPRGPIIAMAMAEARAAVQPEPTPEPVNVYRVEVTLANGATLLVAEASDFEYAKAIGMRVIDEAEAGGTVAVGDATIDGRQVVSVDVLGRNGA